MAIIMKKIKKQFGFTLLELLIVAAVFSVTVLIAVDLFFSITKIQKRIASIQRIESDARFTLEAMAREARMGMVDYDYYETKGIDLAAKTDTLATRDQDRNLTIYKRYDYTAGNGIDDSVIIVCALNSPEDPLDKCDKGPTEADNKWQQVTPREIIIETLDFYIQPAKNPLVFDDLGTKNYLANQQPLVTIILQSKSVSGERAGEAVTNLQTTISSRIYKR
jgi:prepilin-type N-terminal cleavage/methylation domain-containing protein